MPGPGPLPAPLPPVNDIAMIEERLGSPDEFASALAAHLEGPDLPDSRELRSLVEVAFFASLNEEEGQREARTEARTTKADPATTNSPAPSSRVR